MENHNIVSYSNYGLKYNTGNQTNTPIPEYMYRPAQVQSYGCSTGSAGTPVGISAIASNTTTCASSISSTIPNRIPSTENNSLLNGESPASTCMGFSPNFVGSSENKFYSNSEYSSLHESSFSVPNATLPISYPTQLMFKSSNSQPMHSINSVPQPNVASNNSLLNHSSVIGQQTVAQQMALSSSPAQTQIQSPQFGFGTGSLPLQHSQSQLQPSSQNLLTQPPYAQQYNGFSNYYGCDSSLIANRQVNSPTVAYAVYDGTACKNRNSGTTQPGLPPTLPDSQPSLPQASSAVQSAYPNGFYDQSYGDYNSQTSNACLATNSSNNNLEFGDFTYEYSDYPVNGYLPGSNEFISPEYYQLS